ncbi:MAG: chaperonin [Flavobacteriaceae bacterium]|nr:chaperonin [Flavobacteriaceae bacterium]
MKKALLFIAVLFFQISNINAQESQMLSEFEEVKVFSGLTVQLIPSDQNKIEIEGNMSKEVMISQKKSALRLRLQVKNYFKRNNVNIKVYYTNPLLAVEANENSQITFGEKLKQDEILLKAQEGSTIFCEGMFTQLTVRSSAGSDITLGGETVNQEVVVNTGGYVNGKEMKSKYTLINVNAGGKSIINASEEVDIKVRAGGRVSIYGNPKRMKQNTFIGGIIEIF